MNDITIFIIGMFVGIVVTAFNMAFAINNLIDRLVEDYTEVDFDE